MLLAVLAALALLGAAVSDAAPAASRLDDDETRSFWKGWLLLDDPSLSPDDSGRKKGQITPKSVFIAPVIKDLPDCAPGYRADALGRCHRLVKIDQSAQLSFLLQKLNSMYASDKFVKKNPQATTEGPLQVAIPFVSLKTTSTSTTTTTTTTTEAPTVVPSTTTVVPPVEEVEVVVVAAEVQVQDDRQHSTSVPGAIVTLWHINSTHENVTILEQDDDDNKPTVTEKPPTTQRETQDDRIHFPGDEISTPLVEIATTQDRIHFTAEDSEDTPDKIYFPGDQVLTTQSLEDEPSSTSEVSTLTTSYTDTTVTDTLTTDNTQTPQEEETISTTDESTATTASDDVTSDTASTVPEEVASTTGADTTTSDEQATESENSTEAGTTTALTEEPPDQTTTLPKSTSTEPPLLLSVQRLESDIRIVDSSGESSVDSPHRLNPPAVPSVIESKPLPYPEEIPVPPSPQPPSEWESQRIRWPQEEKRAPSQSSGSWSWGSWPPTQRPVYLNFWSELPDQGGSRGRPSSNSRYPATFNGRPAPIFYQELSGQQVANVFRHPWQHG